MSLKHAILAMLDIEEGSGYDLVKRFDASIGFFWASTFQQVYRELQGLERDGYVEAEEIEQSGKPDKKLYQITDDGRKELRKWLTSPAKEMKIKDTLLLKIFAGRQASKQQVVADIELQQQMHSDTLEKYQKMAARLEDETNPNYLRYRLPYQTLLLGIKLETAWQEWAEECKNNLSELEDEIFLQKN